MTRVLAVGAMVAALFSVAEARRQSGRLSFEYNASQRIARARGEPRQPALIPVPPVQQSTEYTCGPASLKSVLAYYGKGDLLENRLARLCNANYDAGTEPSDLRRVTRSLGLQVRVNHHMSFGTLASYVKRGIPVIVGFQAWVKDPKTVDWADRNLNDGHYSVVIGIDRHYVWLMDPYMDGGKRGYIPIGEFKQRWHWSSNSGKRTQRFGMAIYGGDPSLRAYVDGVGRIW